MDSYLIFAIQNYAGKLVEKETSPKYYFMDTGLLGLMLLDCKFAQLENLVAIELIRRYGVENVFYFESNVEIDFYVPSEKLAIFGRGEESLLNQNLNNRIKNRNICKAICQP